MELHHHFVLVGGMMGKQLEPFRDVGMEGQRWVHHKCKFICSFEGLIRYQMLGGWAG